jgi:hypothetical protein
MIGRLGIVSIALCSLGAAAWAQSSGPPANVVHAENAKHAAHPKQAAKQTDDSENWDIADPRSAGGSTDLNSGLNSNDAEGRKKFFEQSTTMESNGPAGSGKQGVPGATGFTPSVGLPF